MPLAVAGGSGTVAHRRHCHVGHLQLQHRLLAEPDRNLGRGEPQVALDHPPRRMLEAVDRIGGQVLRTDRPDPLPEPGDRAGPPDPLGDHRRRQAHAAQFDALAGRATLLTVAPGRIVTSRQA